MNRFLALILCVSLPSTSFASLAYRAPSARNQDFIAWVNANGDGTLASVSTTQNADAKEKLNGLLESAQRAYLEGSLEDSKTFYKKIISLALEEDWSIAQRRAIHFSFIRLAQLAPNESERMQNLTAAAEYAPDLNADSSLFPPPLVNDYEKARFECASTSTSVPVRELFADFDVLVLDGRRIDLQENAVARIPHGNHRVSFVSNAYATVTARLTGAQLAAYKPATRPILSGTCESPAWAIAPEREALAYFAHDCQYRFKGGQWSRLNHKQSVENTWAQLKPMRDPNAYIQTQPAHKTILKSKWFWAGVAGAALAAVMISQRDNQRDAQVIPTERSGY
jgi:hypothetical protein